ncbi:MAG: ABC transporter ATP-binding protein [Actinomycetia bacterium]|nr:ABC transporter ATP-binding protein [Actinomycetes bacterium]MCP4222402.1 ABC transporter ATP-binding protein [Actinomycetes bacterium]MCP5033103.1 ABC transporter ATP-binding protein [Actinomycetes bacterium]
MEDAVLKVSNLKTKFDTRQGTVEAVSDVSFDIKPEETVALVGESGSGKSVTALSIMHLLESTGSIAGGEIMFDGRDITHRPEREMRAIRGAEISMIFQDPATCLDPVFTVENQLREVMEIHGTDTGTARARALELLELVGMPDPKKRLRSYQHQLSGGQRQRVMIALALALRPKLVIADEPTTALDVTVQAQILDLLRTLQNETGAAILFVTHDLGVVAEMADRVVVMYGGQVVEQGTVRDVINDPRHPYTQALLNSMPGKVAALGERLEAIEGTVPSLFDMPTGCRFGPRCSRAWDRCHAEEPPLYQVTPVRSSRCWVADPEAETPSGQAPGAVS